MGARIRSAVMEFLSFLGLFKNSMTNVNTEISQCYASPLKGRVMWCRLDLD